MNADSFLLPPAMVMALAMFGVVSSVTPGPNNIMLTISGVNFGMRRTVPHMAGIAVGFDVMMLAVGFGIGAAMTAFPGLKFALKILGIVYILWLAWRVAFSASLGGERAEVSKPITFLEAFWFQWVNPKAVFMAVGAMGVYVRPGHTLADVLVVGTVFAFINIFAMLLWAGFGVGLRDFLRVPGRIRAFNIVMGLLLVASIVPMARA